MVDDESIFSTTMHNQCPPLPTTTATTACHHNNTLPQPIQGTAVRAAGTNNNASINTEIIETTSANTTKTTSPLHHRLRRHHHTHAPIHAVGGGAMLSPSGCVISTLRPLIVA
jgi:hypothetical protein